MTQWMIASFFGFALSALPAAAQETTMVNTDPRMDFARGSVVEVLSTRQESDASIEPQTVQELRVEIDSGTHAGTTVLMEHGFPRRQPGMRMLAGDTVVLERLWKADGSVEYLIREHYRLPMMVWLVCAFFLLAVFVGRWTGVKATAGLIVSIVILTFLVVPAIINGRDPLLASLVGAAGIAILSIYTAHGFNVRTTIALISTLLTLCMATGIAIVAVHVGKIFGTGSEESVFLQLGPTALLDLRGLLLGGILIGTLGVLDDITTAQAGAVEEISRANASLSPSALLAAGSSVGREHIAALINTLALAYFGTSLPLFLLFNIHNDTPAWVIINSEFIAEEIVRTLVGSSALLLAVPITTGIAVWWFQGGRNLSASHSPAHRHV